MAVWPIPFYHAWRWRARHRRLYYRLCLAIRGSGHRRGCLYTWSTMLYVVASILGTACGGFIRARCDLQRAYIAGALVFLTGPPGVLWRQAWHGSCWPVWPRVGRWHAHCPIIWDGGRAYPADLRSRAFSLISGMWGTAALLGPTVGGVFAAIGWWRGAFWVATPVIVGLMGAWCTSPLPPARVPQRACPGSGYYCWVLCAVRVALRWWGCGRGSGSLPQAVSCWA